MKTTAAASLLLLRAAFTQARCDNGPCDDPAVLNLATSDCQDYHIFTARGSTAPKPGHAGELIRQICEGLGDCGYEDVDYPASGGAQGPGAWCKSAHEGATGGQKQMADYAEKCPDAKLILIGFSQGGSVALDILGGGGNVDVFGCHQEESGPLDITTSPGNKIVAAAVFGPTVRSKGENYTVKGGQDFDGTSARTDASNEAIAPYAAKGILKEWCNKGDPICAKGSTPSSVENHLNYFFKYTDEASKWVVKTVKNGGSSSDEDEDEEETSSTTSSATSSSSATPTPTASTTQHPKAAKQSTATATPTPTPANSDDNTSFGIPQISVARNTWFLCGAVVVGTLFFFVIVVFSDYFRRLRHLSRGFVPV